MREQLANYVNLLFAGTTGTEEIKQEILFNTLDRYDDLVAQGKTPEAAYRLAMTGIGDIDEILSQERPVNTQSQPKTEPFTYTEPVTQAAPDEKEKRTRRAAAIAFYICCPVPLFILGDVLGLCLMLVLIAAATALMVMNGDKDEQPAASTVNTSGRSESARSLIKTIKKFNTLISIIIFLVLSFVTRAWYITWMVFPLFSCINGLIAACIDLKEAK